eukprot:scaffold8224_cov61-Phaeocystis_antarctica.AAC.3
MATKCASSSLARPASGEMPRWRSRARRGCSRRGAAPRARSQAELGAASSAALRQGWTGASGCSRDLSERSCTATSHPCARSVIERRPVQAQISRQRSGRTVSRAAL